MIDLEATQGCLACLDKVKARRADIVRPFTQPERRLRRDQNLISTSFDRFAQDFLGCSSRRRTVTRALTRKNGTYLGDSFVLSV